MQPPDLLPHPREGPTRAPPRDRPRTRTPSPALSAGAFFCHRTRGDPLKMGRHSTPATPNATDGRTPAESVRLHEENARLRAEAAELNDEAGRLRSALADRFVIEQAKGIIAERSHVDIDQAFVLLRNYCRPHSRTIHDVATAIVQHAGRPTA
jgi:hypothetical protein